MVFRRQIRRVILLLLSNFILFVSISHAQSEVEILVKFKSSLANYTALTSWENNPEPPCRGNQENWAGIICQNGAILGLQLENMGLSGTIDVDTLNELPRLRTLSFMNNQFFGPLPEFKKLSGLRSIFLSNNRFSGEIPGNAFEGMVSLRKLYLSNNQFTGQIPASVTTLSRLLELKLDGNKFNGKLPDFNAKGLRVFNISDNQMEGTIPPSLSKMNADSFAGNKGLCGAPLKACESSAAPKPKPNPNPNPNPSPNSNPNNNTSNTSTSMLIILVLTILGILLLITILVLIIFKQSKEQQPSPKVEAPTCVKVKQNEERAIPAKVTKPAENTVRLTFLRDGSERFGLPDLLQANAEILGSGCFGSSYKAALPSGSVMVVKRYKQMNNAGKEEFQEHMRRLGRLDHSNMLPLVAYYYRKEEKLIVCEYVKNGSLAVHLHGHQSLGKPSLDWPTRLNIVKGIARGLAYLHKELPSLVAPHGHLKSSNVLLTESFEPLITDYGLIPVVNQESAQAFMVAYKSPEFVKHGRITKKTDVWGLGVLILEILTGKFPSNFLQKGKGSKDEDIATWVKTVIGDDEDIVIVSTKMEVFDKEIGPVGNMEARIMVRLLKIGLSCCEDDVANRIDLKEAVARIEELNHNISIDGEFYSVIASDSDEEKK